MMVEVQPKNREWVFDCLQSEGYAVLRPDDRELVTRAEDLALDNFCLHRERHADLLKALG
jgi:hypothetical protein